jgi:hypothetical protein
LFYVAKILAWRKTDDTAADGAADLRIGIAEVAVFIICRRLAPRLRLPGQHMRNAMRQPTELREQQGEDHQKPDRQAITH